MAEENSQDNLERPKSPLPSAAKKRASKGQFARSKELIPAATLAMLLIAMRFAGEELLERQGRLLAGFFSAAGTMKQFDVNDLSLRAVNAGGLLAPVLLPVFGAVLVAALASGFMQTGFVLAEEPMRFDLARINPLAGCAGCSAWMRWRI